MNLLWHAGTAVAVTAMVGAGRVSPPPSWRARSSPSIPVHVEAVANVVGRAELMAALAVCLAVYAAVARDSVLWSGLALLLAC